ncbi:MAG: hypothetical protein GEU79_06975 [Acidimicrobiia bacterium]|nr:hypothetical protein [Acidimicrobiia bacterium]
MNTDNTIVYEAVDNRATITINDPERRNPMSTVTMRRLLEATDTAIVDDDVRVIVYTGTGEQAFSAGGDLASGFVDDEDDGDRHEERGALADLFRLMRSGGKPTIARVNGHALAGGFGLAVACDIVVCVDDAKLGTPEINVGLWPMMISAILQRVSPHRKVLEMMMTGTLITPDEALEMGAISRVVGRDDLDDAVDEYVNELTAKSPIVLAMGRRLFYEVEDLALDRALDRLQDGLTEVAATDDAREGVSAFLEKRAPRWKGS